jgi:hypothetical protein
MSKTAATVCVVRRFFQRRNAGLRFVWRLDRRAPYAQLNLDLAARL